MGTVIAVAALLVSIVTGYLNFRYTRKGFVAATTPRIRARLSVEIRKASFSNFRPLAGPGGITVSLTAHNVHDRLQAQNITSVVQVAFVRLPWLLRRYRTVPPEGTVPVEAAPVDLVPGGEAELRKFWLDTWLLNQDLGLERDPHYRPDGGEEAFEAYRMRRRGHLCVKAAIGFESASGVKARVRAREQLKPALMDTGDGKSPIVTSWISS